jgi:hypothetical protein
MTNSRGGNNRFRKKKNILIAVFLSLFSLFVAFLFSAYSDSRTVFHVDFFTKAVNNAQYDNFERLIAINGKKIVACPSHAFNTGVLLVIGQSNAANHAEKKITTRFPHKVFNYYDGKCTIAASPLLGASGDEGEFITLLADKLIENGTYKEMVIISSAIKGTAIARWQANSDLNHMLLDTLAPIKKFKVTDIIWHQGESDYENSTSEKVYQKNFYTLKDSLRNSGITAPFFIAIATKCGNNLSWKANNPTALGQKKLEDKKQIFLAVNTDELLETKDRRSDFCHFSETGQIKTAAAYAHAIQKYHQSHLTQIP